MKKEPDSGKRFVVRYANAPMNKGIESYLRVCLAESTGKSFSVFKDANRKNATRFSETMADGALVMFGEPPPGHQKGALVEVTEGADLRPKTMSSGRIIIPASQIEFEDNGNTIWVQGADGSTIMRIKTNSEIRAVPCETSPVSHTDVNTVGVIKFCISRDAEVIAPETVDDENDEEEDDG